MFHRAMKACVLVIVGVASNVSASNEYAVLNDFEWLSTNVKETLQREGCRIPTRIDDQPVSGIVSGEFGKIGQTDVAIMCDADEKSEILIFWGGRDRCPSRLTAIGDSLTVVGESYILQHYDAYGGAEPPPISHQAINDIILEKASVVRYCHNGSWVELTGAD